MGGWGFHYSTQLEVTIEVHENLVQHPLLSEETLNKSTSQTFHKYDYLGERGRNKTEF